MRLTPLDIKKQEFKKSLRGYDTVEVDMFLEMLSSDYEGLVQQNSALLGKVTEVESQLREYRQIERTLQQALVQAQELANKTVDSAKKEAASLIKDAENRAAQSVEKAQFDAANIRGSVELEVSRMNERAQQETANMRLNANDIKQSAELEAAQMIERAQREVADIRNKAEFIQSQKVSLLENMKTLLLSQLDMLKSLEKEEPFVGSRHESMSVLKQDEKPFSKDRTETREERDFSATTESEFLPAPPSESLTKEAAKGPLQIDEIVKRLERDLKLFDYPSEGTADDGTQKED